MDALAKALLAAGPPFYLAACSILLNVALMAFIVRLLGERREDQKEMTAALVRSADAIDASNDGRSETVNLMREYERGQALSFAKLESLLAITQAKLGG